MLFVSRGLNTSMFIGEESCPHVVCQPEDRMDFGTQFFSSHREKIPSFPGSSLGLDEVCIISLLNLPLVFALLWFSRSGGAPAVEQTLEVGVAPYSSARSNCHCHYRKKTLMRVG